MIGAGRAYAVTFDNQTVANASGDYDLWSATPAADKPFIVEAIYLSNVGGTADAGDAQEELLRLRFLRMTATVTITGGTSANVTPLLRNDTAASFTAKHIHATVATTTGATEVLHNDGWNVRIPYVWLPPPEHRYVISTNGTYFIVRSDSTLADDISVSGTMILREMP